MNFLTCPVCKSNKLHKAGFSWSGHNKRQRYCCLECHGVTIKPLQINKIAEANSGKRLTSATKDEYHADTT